ncbi:MAG: holo-ACP synthase [Clostridia bacterium]|jgi:holo-[acyl-carrier protein] synthase|nr:holo-ACP synthase [Clostridia bacterium]
MIIGVGADLVEIERIKDAVDKNINFLKKYFSSEEIDYFDSKNLNPETIAANFAAKEAVSKAFGTGVRNFELRDIEVLRNKIGKPYVVVHDKAKELKEELEIKNILVSLSHTDDYAIAYAVCEK